MNDSSISQKHASLRFEQSIQEFVLQDEDSKFGSLLLIQEPVKLSPERETTIQIGCTLNRNDTLPLTYLLHFPFCIPNDSVIIDKCAICNVRNCSLRESIHKQEMRVVEAKAKTMDQDVSMKALGADIISAREDSRHLLSQLERQSNENDAARKD